MELEDPELDARTKQQRWGGGEVQVARQSSTAIPRSSPIFKIQIVMPGRKRQHRNRVQGSSHTLSGQQEA